MSKVGLQQIYAKLFRNEQKLAQAIAAYKSIVASPLFDCVYYSKRYHDIDRSGLEAAAHYILFGAKEKRSPHPLFNPDFYQKQLEKRGIKTDNLLHHYLSSQLSNELMPMPFFDPIYYRSQDLKFTENPLEHYLTQGANQGLDPFPLFDTKLYVSSYGDVALSKINALVHYWLRGGFEGRNTHALFNGAFYLRRFSEPPLQYADLNGSDANEIWTKFIDASLAVNPDPDHPPDSPARANPLWHYLRRAAVEDRNPNRLFWTKFYMKENPDVAESGMNPLVHYVLHGQSQHRMPHPRFNPKAYLNQIADANNEAVQKPLEHRLKNATKWYHTRRARRAVSCAASESASAIYKFS